MSTRPNRQQQRLARQIKRERGIPYQAALEIVRRGPAGQPPAPPATPAPPALTVPAGRAACWWCDAQGPLTLEHVLARWVVDALDGAGALDHAYTEHGAEEATRRWSAVRPEFKAKVVCARCNNGWLSALEDRAAVVLADLVAGRAGRLTADESGVAARWAAKTVMTFQALEVAADRVVDRALYRQLMDADVLPPTLRVWAGRIDAHGALAHAFGGTIRHRRRAARHLTGLLTLDRLALMIMGSPDDAMLDALELGHLGNAWVELGRGPAAWPPPFEFDRRQFAAMPQLVAHLAAIPANATP